MRASRRVVITGLGVVSPIGIGKDAFWQNLIAGKSGVDHISTFDPPYPCQIAAEVKAFSPADFMTRRSARQLSRCSQLSLAAAQLAIADSHLQTPFTSLTNRVGVCFGTSANGTPDIGENNHRAFLKLSAAGLSPLAMLELPAHASTSHVAREFCVSGPSTTIASGCASGLDAVLWGTSLLQSGQVDIAIVGAADAPLTQFIFSLFSAGNFLATWDGPPNRASRPYDLLRSGLVLAEGSAALILEDLEHAHARGANIYAEILGTGNASEGGFRGRIADVYCQTLQVAMTKALAAADLLPEQLDHINAHGNSTQTDDAADTAAFKGLLRDHAYRISISSIKGAVGQPLAAAGVLQITAAALSIAFGCVPPTINQELRDPACDLDYVPNNSRPARLRKVLVHSHSLGGVIPGSHSAVVIGHPNF